MKYHGRFARLGPASADGDGRVGTGVGGDDGGLRSVQVGAGDIEIGTEIKRDGIQIAQLKLRVASRHVHFKEDGETWTESERARNCCSECGRSSGCG